MTKLFRRERLNVTPSVVEYTEMDYGDLNRLLRVREYLDAYDFMDTYNKMEGKQATNFRMQNMQSFNAAMELTKHMVEEMKRYGRYAA